MMSKDLEYYQYKKELKYATAYSLTHLLKKVSELDISVDDIINITPDLTKKKFILFYRSR